MAQGINFDLKARVVGYEESLNQLKKAFDKIDPGSAIGKKLSKVIEEAEGRLKDLNKNLTPKATNDNQIDNIIEKVNTMGDALQHASHLMQSVTGKDLKVGVLGEEIQQVIQKIKALETQINGSVNKGFVDFLTGPEEAAAQMRKTFIELGEKVRQLSSEDALKVLTKGLKDAQAEAEKAGKALDQITEKLTKQQEVYNNKFGNNPFANDNFNEVDVATRLAAIKTPDKILDSKKIHALQQQMLEGLSNLKLDEHSEIAINLLNQMFQGLTPENIALKMNTLMGQLKEQFDISKKDFRAYLLNGQSDTRIINSLLGIDESQLEEAKIQLRNQLQEIARGLDPSKVASIKTLIDNGEIEKARDATISAMHEAYEKIQRELKEEKEKIAQLEKEVAEAATAKTNASNKVERVKTSKKNYDTIINDLNQQLKTLKQEKEELEKQLEEAKENSAGGVRNEGSSAGNMASIYKISAEEAGKYHAELDQVHEKEKLIGKIEGIVQRWFSIYTVVRTVNSAIRSVISTVQELDKTITEIAIVTDMTQDELWGQMSSYVEMAREYAASISGVYQVSQLYYQQGLQTADVMALTEETLKMARISGLGYAEATDYMTNAVRSFKMEMTDAQRVVDVYSEIAASSATSTTELATAMSKTASSAEAVGSSFENTTAMMAVMIEATRESATNIGSAMKSIISRYGEMTTNPSKLVDSEGEAMSLNKVDKALQSVGITIQDANHQFREFDDVIAELAGKWDTIDNNTQRYIATVMAGNRQQSRFLALVSNGERLAELSEKAANAEDAATLQVLKTMDSIQAKSQQLKTSLQSLYASTGVQNFFKGILDISNEVVKTFTRMPTILNLPIPAIAKLGTSFANLATLVTNIFAIVKTKLAQNKQELNLINKVANNEQLNDEEIAAYNELVIQENKYSQLKTTISEGEKELNQIKQEAAQESINQANTNAQLEAKIRAQANAQLAKRNKGMVASAIGLGLSSLAANVDVNKNRELKGGLTLAGSLTQAAGTYFMMGGGAVGAIMAAITAVTGALESLNILFESSTARAERLKEAATAANNDYIQQRSAAENLQEQIDKLKELEKAQYDSEEARQSFIELNNEMAEQHPELISSIDNEGNAIINLEQSYLLLAEARKKAAEAAKKTAAANNEQAVNAEEEAKNNYREKARVEIGNFNSRVIGSKQLSYEDRLKEALSNDNLDYDKLLNWIQQTAIAGGDQNSTFTYLLGQGIEINDDELRKKLLELFQSIGDQFLQGIEAVDPSSDLKMGDYLADAVKDSEFLSRIIKAMDSENNIDELQKIFSEEDFVKKLEAAKTEVENSEDAYVNELVEYISKLYYELLPEEGKVKQAENKTEAVRRSGIAELVRANLSTDDFPYLNEMQNAFAFITEAIYESSETAADYDAFLDTVPDRVTTLSDQLSEIWKNLTPNEKDNFNNLITNAGHYSEDNFREALSQYEEIDEDLTEAIIASLYDRVYNVEKFTQAVQNLDTDFDLSTYNDLLNQLGSQDLLYILDIYKNIDKQIQSKAISQDRGNKIIDAYMSLFTTASGFDDDFAEASQLISGMSDFSLDGITKFQESVNNSGLSENNIATLNEAAEGLKGIIPINLNTEINTFVSSVTEGMSDFESALEKATKGMGYKDAAEIAGKMGVSVSDFRRVGTKYFVDDLEKLKKAYIQVDESLLNIVDGEIESVEKALKSVIPEEINTGKAFLGSKFDSSAYEFAFKNAFDKYGINIDINELDISKKYDEWYKISDQTDQTFIEYLIESLNSRIENAKEIEKFVDTQMAEISLANGDFSKFLEYLHLSESKTNEYKEYFEKGEFEKLLEIFPQYADTIINTFKNIGLDLLKRITSESAYDNYVEIDSSNAAMIAQLEAEGLATHLTDDNGKIIGAQLAELTKYNIDAYNKVINNLPLTSGEKAEEAANGTKALYEDSLDNLINEIIKNSTNVSATTVESIRQQFIETFGETVANKKIDQLFKTNENGTYEANINELKNILAGLWYNLTSKTRKSATEAVQKTADDLIKDLSTATSLLIKGTNNAADKQSFVDSYKKLTNKNISIDDAFSYDEVLGADTLNYELYHEYINADAKAAGKAKGLAGKALNEFIKDYIARQNKAVAKEVDIKSFLNAEDNSENSQAYKVLANQMKKWYSGTKLDEQEAEKRIAKSINNILKGGQTAVDELLKWSKRAGEEVSEKDVELAYKGELSNIENAFEQLSYGVGAIVSGQAKEILGSLSEAGWKINDIEGTDSAVIESIGDVTAAYVAYYNKLVSTNKASFAALNEAMAKILELREGSDVIEALGDAGSMTYTRLGEILASQGIELTNNFIEEYQDVFQSIGGGKVRIINFEKFATDIMKWTDVDTNSEEYVSAFKTYNDSLIDMNRKAERNIVEEVKALEDAKGGDWVNLTQLYEELHEKQADWYGMVRALEQYDATIEDGILKISEGANILEIQRTIYNTVKEKDRLIDSNLAALADTIANTIAGYGELISNGINGKLSNVDAVNLQNFASNYGLQIDFHQTEQGLKLSQQSAMALYTTMKQVDYLQSRVVFKELSDNLKESTRSYQDVVAIQGRIADLQKQINSLPVGSARRKEYERELEVAKEIREVRSLTDENAFNFMNNDLPTPFKAQLGYWDSIGSAFKEMNDAADSGYMDVTKFYNMVNGFNDMAKQMGSSINFMGMELDGSMESASKAIQKGFSSLANVDGEGAKISLERWGNSFEDGAKGMQKGVKAGVRAMAKSQIEMLDAMIAQLELVVAMEELEPVDKDEDNALSMEELFPNWLKGDYTLGADAKDAIQNILDLAEKNKDLANALDTFQIEGKSMRYWMQQAIDGNIKNKDTAQIFQATLSALYTALQTGDWSPETIKSTIIQNLQANIKEGEWREFTLTDGTKVRISQKGYIEQDKKGKWRVSGDGKEYDSFEAAQNAAEKLTEFAEKTGITDGHVNEKGLAEKTYNISENTKVTVTQNVNGEIEYVVSKTGTGTTKAKTLRGAVRAIISREFGKDHLNADHTVQEADILNLDLVSKLGLSVNDVEILTGQNVGNLSDKMLTALGIDTSLVGAIEAGIQRAFTDSKFNFVETILNNLIGKENLQETDTSKWADNPKLVWVGNQLGQGIMQAVKNGVVNQNNTDPNAIPDAVADGVKDEQGSVAAEGDALGKKLVDTLLAFSEPDGPMKIAGMDAATAFVEGFTLYNVNDQTYSFGDVFGSRIMGVLRQALITDETRAIGQETVGTLIEGMTASDGKSSSKVQQLADSITGPIKTALTNLFSQTTLDDLIDLFKTNSDLVLAFDSIDISGLTETVATFETAMATANTALSNIITTINGLEATGPLRASLFTLAVNGIKEGSPGRATEFTTAVNAVDKEKVTQSQNFINAVNGVQTEKVDLSKAFVNAIASVTKEQVNQTEKFVSAINDIKAINVSYAHSFKGAINGITNNGPNAAVAFKNTLNSMRSKNITVTLTITDNGGGHYSWRTGYPSSAKGNFALVKGNTNTNSALAKGRKTLMGELGPELYVTNGRYYVAGQNGAEMVDLPDDAIVFNHLQTKRLLGTGRAGRGKPVTNEKRAVSYATGNVSGPAMASAKETLELLKALRAMWQSMLTASSKQLGSLAASNKDKGKTKDKAVKTKDENGNEKTTIIKISRVTDDIDRWYNLLRQIDKLEKDIAYSEKLISKYQADRVINGNKIYQNYKNQLKMLDSEIIKNRELVQIQRDWYNHKREELANSSYGLVFRYDENGLQQYVQGENRGLDFLEKLFEETVYGEGIKYSSNAERQLAYLIQQGVDVNALAYDNSDANRQLGVFGYNRIFDYNTSQYLEGQDLADQQAKIVQNYSDMLDTWQQDMDNLADTMHETEEKILDEQIKQNEILQEITNNQLEVEDTVLNAITDAREAEIDELQKERDAYQDSVDRMISGLNDALDNEQRMYEDNENRSELTKLQRQLAILQRSGGSASQIRDLQNQISSQQKDLYFDERQKEIQAIQDASDKQIERMDAQIDLMNDTLEYQKEHGLLWNQVYNVMAREESEILGFITENGADWEAKSSLQKQEDIRAILEKIQIWTQSRDDKELQELGVKIDNQEATTANRAESSFNSGNTVTITVSTSGSSSSNKSNSNNNKNNDYSTKNYNNNNNNNDGLYATIRKSTYTTISDGNGKFKTHSFDAGEQVKVLKISSTGNAVIEDSSGNRYTIRSTYLQGYDIEEVNSRRESGGIGDIATIATTPGNYQGYEIDKDGNRMKNKYKTYSKTDGDKFKILENLGDYLKVTRMRDGKQMFIRKSSVAFKSGGLIDFTGPAWVDGSKSKPESILSADQTKSFREFVNELKAKRYAMKTSNSINFEELYKMRDAIDEMRIAVDKLYDNPNSSDTNNMGITIENVVLNMNVSKIANDYDAARAGQKVLDEFVRVARKNGVNSLSRR